jgi:hypothetical protein
MTNTFEIGKTYFSNGGNPVDIKIVDRTARTATVECNGKTLKVKITVYNYVNEHIEVDLRTVVEGCAAAFVDVTFYPQNIRQTGVAEEIAELVRAYKNTYSKLCSKIGAERERSVPESLGGGTHGIATEELDRILMTAGLSKVEACEVLVKGGCYGN